MNSKIEALFRVIADGALATPYTAAHDVQPASININGDQRVVLVNSSGIPVTPLLTAQWTLVHAPAVNVIASATRAAGAAGVRNVLQSLSAKVSIFAALTAPLYVVVRDGASGVGAILYEEMLDGDRIGLSGLTIVGTAATAMTVEFTTAAGANNFECLSAGGYSV